MTKEIREINEFQEDDTGICEVGEVFLKGEEDEEDLGDGEGAAREGADGEEAVAVGGGVRADDAHDEEGERDPVCQAQESGDNADAAPAVVYFVVFIS